MRFFTSTNTIKYDRWCHGKPRNKVIALCLLLACAVACAPEKPSDTISTLEARQQTTMAQSDTAIVATVNHETLSLAEFERRINSLQPFAKARYRTNEQKKNYLEYMAIFEAMADVAEQQGYGDHPLVRARVKDYLAQSYLKSQIYNHNEKEIQYHSDDDIIDEQSAADRIIEPLKQSAQIKINETAIQRIEAPDTTVARDDS